MISASAPAKVVLGGEYAVLDGAPGICMAVDRRAVASIAPTEDDGLVAAPGITDLIGRFRWIGDELSWLDGAEEYRLVDPALRTSGRRDALAIALNTMNFADDAGNKYGIGSSAAIMVALCAALHESADVYEIAAVAHRVFQDGAGSGIDIACSTTGGLIAFQRGEVESLAWPEDLHFRLLWTGAKASTAEKIAALAKTDALPSRERLAEKAAQISAAWRGGDAGRILADYPVWIEALREFSDDYGLDVFGAGHDALVSAAADAGLVYKPCGAGGGDVGVVLGIDPAALDEFVTTSGIAVVECALDDSGVRIEQS